MDARRSKPQLLSICPTCLDSPELAALPKLHMVCIPLSWSGLWGFPKWGMEGAGYQAKGRAMKRRRALITGINGQDGSYLAEWLLEQGYEVHGLVRDPSPARCLRLSGIRHRITLWKTEDYGGKTLLSVLRNVQPSEIYHLAALTFVQESWQKPIRTHSANMISTLRLLEALRRVCPEGRFFQAGTSEMFGQAPAAPQSETTPFHPRSPYGLAKLHAHYTTTFYREQHGVHASSGIMFNHESPRRGEEFVTRKITRSVARIKLGLERELRLGNLQSCRDWGHARDFVQAMWLMLQQDQPDDYVIGTGKLHQVEEFVASAFDQVGLNWRSYVVVDPAFYRPTEAVPLQADASKARTTLGWTPSCRFEDMVREMVDADLALERQRLAA